MTNVRINAEQAGSLRPVAYTPYDQTDLLTRALAKDPETALGAELLSTYTTKAELSSTKVELSSTYAPMGIPVTLTATTALMQAVATNAPTYQTTPTYDASGVAVHPSVIQIAGGFGPQRFPFWMAMTPYTGTNNAVENPSILASYDGYTWVVPDGLTNPIKARTLGAGDFNSDPCLVFEGGLMYCFYRSVEAAYSPATERLYYKTTSDGITWSDETLVLSNDPAVSKIVSPAFAKIGDTWHMWGNDIAEATNTIKHWTSTTTPTAAEWSAPTDCTISNVPAGYEPWHLDIKQVGAELVAILHETVGGASTAAGSVLHRAISIDGETWTGDNTPFLMGADSNWDEGIYKATFLPALANGVAGYRLWYSALSGSADWHIGHTVVTLRHREEPANPGLAQAAIPQYPYLCGDLVNRADDTSTAGVMTSGTTWGDGDNLQVSGGTLIYRSSYGTAHVDFGVEDIEIGATLRAVPVDGKISCLTACRNGLTDYLRFGPNGTANYNYNVRFNNASTVNANSSKIAPAVGQRVKVRIKDGTAWCYVDELAIARLDVSDIDGYTSAGLVVPSSSNAAWDDFYIKAI